VTAPAGARACWPARARNAPTGLSREDVTLVTVR
jgi:hypothetical protein